MALIRMLLCWFVDGDGNDSLPSIAAAP